MGNNDKRKQKILFINPPSPNKNIYIRDLNRSGRRSKEMTIWPQVSLAHLAGMFPNDECYIWDCIAERWDYNRLFKEVKLYQPNWIIFNVISSTYHNDMRIVELAKKFNAKSVAIGCHVTANHREVLEEYPDLDYIAGGEVEKSFYDIVKEKAGIENGVLWQCQLMDLKDLPMARQDLLPLDKYYMPFIGKCTFVVASRGCPYECIFCRQPIMWQRKVRLRPVKNIIEEITKYNLKNIMFHADTFTINKEWVMELCEAIKPLKIKWCCNSRIDTVTPPMLKAMAQSGCWMIMWGIEHCNNKILEQAKKSYHTYHKGFFKYILEIANKLGIKNWGYFVLGLPGETKQTLRECIDFAKSLPLTFANFAIASPYPGTEFYDMAKKNNWLISDKWEDFDQNYSAIVSYPDLSAQEITKWMKQAYREFYFRPKYIKMFLKEWREWKRLLQIGWKHL